jgi:2-dehydropantoate 2-reductase
MIRGILIVGSGALATLMAARLSAAKIDVTMLGTWPEGLAALRKKGAGLEGEGSYPVNVTNDPAECKGAKTALIFVKSWQTARVARQLVDCLGADGLAVTFQNGLGNDDILAGVLGRQHVIRGVTTLGATQLAPGVVRSNGGGELTLEAHEKLKMLEASLRAAKFELKVVEDLQPYVWGKLVINAAINPLTALLRVKNGELLASPPACELMGKLARETASVAEALGVRLLFSAPERAVEEVARQTSENSSSMLQDILHGTQTEVDVINGAVVFYGGQNGVPTPVNQVIYSLVKALSRSGKI